MIRLKRNKKILRWTFFLVIPLFIYTGCGDLEPDMQDTRTVILNMDFHGKSSSRSSSSVSTSELSQYNTHLILALPSGEVLTSNYRNFHSIFAQGLMNTADKKVSLEIPLNTQMKIFAFLFKETYSLSDLKSGLPSLAGYYGKSQTFSIGTQTNNLSLDITLQSTGTPTGDGGGTDPDTDTGSDDGNDGGTETAPAAPVISGISTGAYTTSQIFTVNGESGATIQYSLDGGSIWTAYSAAVTLTSGSYTITARQRSDAAGNWSANATDITVEINQTTTTIDNSLVAYYPFNGNANDLTDNGRNLAVFDITNLIAGKDNSPNSAYSFDGVGDYLEYTTDFPSFDNYTISLWAKPASAGTYEAMFSSDNNSGRGFQIDLDGSNFRIRIAGVGSLVLGTALLNGDWTFIAFTYDGTNYIGYMNDNITESEPGGTTEFDRFRIGRNRNGNTYFAGAIDELKIYNRALTASEISSLYAN